MQGPQEFGIRVDGKYPSELEQYRKLICIDRYPDSSRQKTGDRRIKYRRDKLEEEFETGELPPLVEDLLNISLATFAADQAVERDVALNMDRAEDRYYSRNIELHIPVSEKELWNSVRDTLNELVSFMTYDAFEYHFLTRDSSEVEYQAPDSDYDSVSMFSGGLDSLGGSYHLRNNGYQPRFLCVNHSGLGTILDNLERVVDVDPLRLNLDQEGLERAEDTQFSRSLLYLSFGVALAIAHDVEEVFIPENGIIARQIGLQEGRLTTRTVHPKTLRLYNEIIGEVFTDRSVSVENPFTYWTKTQVVNEIKDREAVELAISCAHTRFLPNKYAGPDSQAPKHCGMGMPCLIRTISLLNSRFENPEELLNIYYNPFTTDFEDIRYEKNINLPDSDTQAAQLKNHYRDSLVNTMDLLKLAAEFNSFSHEELIERYSGLGNRTVYEMYRDFADEILQTQSHYQESNPTLEKALNRVTP